MASESHGDFWTRLIPLNGMRRPGAKALRPRLYSFAFVIVTAAFLPFLSVSGHAQAPANANQAAPTQSKKPAHIATRHRRKHQKTHAKTAQAAPPVAPQPPPPPVPPALQSAQPAKITFSQNQLSIDAQNSSLAEILRDISSKTGMQIQGLNHDERIYGDYGPGSVTSTLTALLDGSGYNFVLIGSSSGSSPMQLLLNPGSGETPATNTAGVPTPNPSSAAPQNEPSAAQAGNGSNPTAPKTPQQIFEELKKMHPQ